MGVAYYKNKRGIGQLKRNTFNLMSGLNSYEKSDMISDNHLSDAWDASVDSTVKAISLHSRTSNSLIVGYATGSGRVVNAIAARDINNQERIGLLTYDYTDEADAYLDDFHIVYEADNSIVTIDISSYNLEYEYTSMCLFSTEAQRFICFVANNAKYLYYYDFTTFSSVALPFYPKRIVSHYNRIFALDTGNKLWWCRAGDLASWYGLEEDDDKIVTSTNMLDSTAYTIAAQPDVPRPLVITVTKVGTIDTLGTLTVVGTDALGEAQTKTYTPVEGRYVTFDTWKTITSITAAGHTAVGTVDKIKIGIAPVTGYVQDDAGMWTLDQESSLVDLAVLGDSLYIWTPVNIYIFQGYSYDTFSLTKIISNLGIFVSSSAITYVTTCGNIAYFWGTENDLYEYNGNDYPKIINRPVYVNGSVSNGVYGSLETYNANYHLTAIAGKLYVYSNTSADDSVTVGETTTYYRQLRVYEFDTKTRSWWKRAGFSAQYDEKYLYGFIEGMYIGNFAKSALYNILSSKNSDANVAWGIYDYMGTTYTGGSYAVTKAFNDGISEDLTLTNIILYLRYDKPGGPR